MVALGVVRPLLLACATCSALLSIASSADAQVVDRLRKRAKRAAEQEVGRKVESTTRDAVRCAVGDKVCAEKATKEGKSTVFVDAKGDTVVDANGKPIADADAAAQASEAPGTGVWRNYDFVPGNTVVYALDLSDEPIGRFPAKQLEFVRGNAQVVERNGERVIEFTTPTILRVPLADSLPDDFTVEFDFKGAAPHLAATMVIGTNPGSAGHYGSNYFIMAQNSGVGFKGQTVAGTNGLFHLSREMTPVRIQVDGDASTGVDYAILYVGNDRVGQMPNAHFPRARQLEFYVPGDRSRPAYLANIVVAVHGDPLYDALRRDGSYTTRGILFDIDSDRLRPESTPTLREILTALKSHADLSLMIEGHTDATGDDAHNQSLSERRANAVVDYLVKQGVDRGRLSAIGKGETAPVADNATEAGRQQNRRVVLRSGAKT